MKAKQYFLLSFLVPIILPLILWGITKPSFKGIGALVWIFQGSLFLGGIPYLLFLAGLFYWAYNKDAKAIRRFTFFSPILFIPVFVYCALALIPLQILKTGTWNIQGSLLLSLCSVILILGYFYVILVNAVFYLLRSIRLIKEEDYSEQIQVIPRTLGRGTIIVLAFALALPFLLIPVSLFIAKRDRLNYPERIAALKRDNEKAFSSRQELINIIYEQAMAKHYDEARENVISYVEDKDQGFRSIARAQTNNGAYEEAKSTAQLISAPTPRIMMYCEIALEQFKKNDNLSARRTFAIALEEAKRPENADLRRFTLSIIACALAKTDFDTELKEILKIIEPSELVDTYKNVAMIKVERGSLNEAREYFQEAIKHANDIKEPISRDSNLANIARSQADVGLFQDAKATIGDMSIEESKKIALNSISLEENKIINK